MLRQVNLELPDLWLWLRMAVSAGVILASASLVPRMPGQVLIGLGLVVCVVMIVRRPIIGLLALIPATLVVPSAIGTGTQTSINAGILVLALLVFIWITTRAHGFLGRRSNLVPRSRPVCALLALAGAAIAAFIVGTQTLYVFARTAPLNSQLGGLAVFLLATGAFLLTATWLRNEQWLRYLTWLFLASGAIYLVGRLAARGDAIVQRFADGSVGSMFWVWVAALAFAQAVVNRKLHPVVRVTLFGIGFATLLAGWEARGWTSGWLPPLVAVLTITWLRSWRIGLIITVAGAALVLLRDPGLIDSLFGLKDYSIFTRNEARNILLTQVFPISPIFGLGPANYYWYTPFFPILGYNVQFNSHNNYVDVLMQTGLVGLACFGWFIFEIGRLSWGLRKIAPTGFQRAYVYGTIGGLAGTLTSAWLGDWLLPFVYNVGLAGFRASILAWLFLGGLVAIDQMNRKVLSVSV